MPEIDNDKIVRWGLILMIALVMGFIGAIFLPPMHL